MNPQEFANKIRTKYPGAYDNVPDDELTQKVIAKYPVYASQVKIPTQTPQDKVLTGLEDTLGTKDTTADIKQIGTDIKEAARARTEKVQVGKAAMEAGEQGVIRTGLQTLGQAAGLGADVIGATVKGVVKGALPQGGEDVLKSTAASVISPILNSDTAQAIKTKYDEIKDTNPALARDIDSALGAVDFLSNFVGIGAGGKVASVGWKAVQATVKAAGETIETGAKIVPKLLSYTSDVPETAFKILSERTPAVTKAIKTGVTAEKARDTVVNAVKGFRKTLSQEWDDGVQGIIKGNEGVRFGLSDNLSSKAAKISEEFGIELPQNIKNISANEAVGLLKKINELPTAMLTLSPKGALVREFKQELKDLAIKSFGGEKGQFAKLYTNYSTKKGVLDAANDIVNAYAGNKPIKVATAQSRLTKIFDENKTAYLDAIVDLEKATGQDLLSDIVAGKFSKIMPQASGLGGGFTQKALKLLILPLSSPRGAAFIQKALNRTSRYLE